MAKPKKTICPVSRAEFREKAVPVAIVLDNVPMTVPVKEFSTGSLGWYLNGKAMIDVGGTKVAVQIGLNLTIVGSKDLPGGPVAVAKVDEERAT